MENISYGQWIQDKLEELANQTKTDGQIWRPSYSDHDRTGHELLRTWITDAGLEWREDVIGNVYGRLSGVSTETILIGSHIDTVKNGGKYDGAAGVITGLAVLKFLKEQGVRPQYTLEVVDLVEEEGSRFAASCQGSCAICGTLGEQELMEKDVDGITFLDAAHAAGYAPERMEQAKRDDIRAYLELHIEQGPLLEQSGNTIGVVENIVGIATYDITIHGEQNHAGTTVMSLRKDPVVAAARLISSLTDEISARSPSATVTFGRVDTDPGMPNVIAGRAHLLLDMREKDEEMLREHEALLMELVQKIQSNGMQAEAVRTQWTRPVAMDPRLVQRVHEAAEVEGYPFIHMNSGAGHDAMVFGKKVPTAMIFVPSCKGISHNPLEYTSTEDLYAGFRVLCRTVVTLANPE